MPNELMKTLTVGANTYDLPQKTSDLTNDSGFITSETDPTVPSWAKASSKPTYTASEVGAATSSHTHGNITNSGDITTNATIASGDRIIINDESASKITNSSITFGSSTTQYLANNGTWQNVPTVPTKTSDLTNDSGFLTSESDPIFSASAAHDITSTDITNWNGKSDFSGSYNDLSDKPTIPSEVTESTVAGWGFTKNTGTYSKPSGGIPKTDLASAVQTSLGKADTALQSYTESDPIFTASAAHGITSTDITNWNNKISEPASEGTNGQVLMTNGSGTRTWGSVSTADEKIKLTSQSTSGNYPLIFGPTSITSNSTYQGYYNTGITINPNTKAVTATTFVGALTGTASGNLTSSSTLDASKLSGAIPSAVTATTQTSTDNSTKIATTAFVQTAIDNLPEPMVFKGSLGTGGTITSLPTASTSNTGYTYKVITAGTYASQSAKIGDTFISDGSAWILIPSGDEPSGTVTSITLKATSPISIDSNSAITTSGTRTLSHADSGVTAGTYKSVTVDSKGHVTAGSNPSETDPVFTSSAAYGISSSDITNWNGKTSNTGTVTSVRVQATSPVTSSTSTAQSATLNTTIALADGYGDTKNPYASKTKNYVLAAPSNANGVPGFRTLVADDIPSLTKSKISDFPTDDFNFTTGSYTDINGNTVTALYQILT